MLWSYREASCCVGGLQERAATVTTTSEAADEEEGPLHESNEWGIEVVSGADLDGPARQQLGSSAAAAGQGADTGGSNGQDLPAGLQFAMPVSKVLAHARRVAAPGQSVWAWEAGCCAGVC